MKRDRWRTGLAAIALAVTCGLSVREAVGHHSPQKSGDGRSERRAVRIPVPDFSLTDQNRDTFRFSRLRGKVVVVSFIYTTCPDLCPLITTALRSVQNELKPSELGEVFFLSVTTDPEVDKPAVLKSYGERHRIDFSRWSFLTGGHGKVGPVWKAFGVQVDRKARGLVDHTLLTALVDRKGLVRVVYPGAAPDHDVVLEDLRRLLSSN